MHNKFDIARYSPSVQKLCKLPAYPPHCIDPAAEYADHLAIGLISKKDLPDLIEIAKRLRRDTSTLGEYAGAPLHAWIALARLEPVVAVPKMLNLMNRIDWEVAGGYGDRIWQMLATVACGAKKNGEAFDVVAALLDALKEKERHSRVRIMLLDALHRIVERYPEYQQEFHRILLDDLMERRIGNRHWYAAVVRELAEGAGLSSQTIDLIRKASLEGYVDLAMALFDDEFDEAVGFDRESNAELYKWRDDFMEVYRIIRAFRECDRTFPEAAIHKAREYRDLIIPTLIEEVRDATAYARFDTEPDDGVVLFAVHLLAEFQASEALPAVCDSLSLTEDQCFDYLYEGSLFEALHGILYRLIGNDLSFYDQRLRDANTPPVLRSRLLAALPYLVKNGVMSGDEYFDLIAEYLKIAIDEKNEKFVTDLICDIHCSENPKYWPLAREAFDKDLVEEEIISRENVEADLHGKPRFGPLGMQRLLPKDDFSDTIKEMSWWAWFHPEPKEMEPSKPASPKVIDVSDGPPMLHLSSLGRSPAAFFAEDDDDDESEPLKTVQKVGRNDPCPCGSGKKYKKCCMK